LRRREVVITSGRLSKRGIPHEMAIDNGWLVVWNIFYMYILGIIIPTDELIFFRGVGQPPTSNN